MLAANSPCFECLVNEWSFAFSFQHQMTRGSSAREPSKIKSKITDGGKEHSELQSNDSSPQYIINCSRSVCMYMYFHCACMYMHVYE